MGACPPPHPGSSLDRREHRTQSLHTWKAWAVISLPWRRLKHIPSLGSVSLSAKQSAGLAELCCANELRDLYSLSPSACASSQINSGFSARIQASCVNYHAPLWVLARRHGRVAVALILKKYLTALQKSHHRKKLALTSHSKLMTHLAELMTPKKYHHWPPRRRLTLHGERGRLTLWAER